MFASKVTKDIKVGEETVTVKKLGNAALDKAREIREGARARSLRDFGGDVLKVLRSETLEAFAAKAKVQDSAAVKARRYDAYDRASILNSGISSWTMQERVTPENIADLDQDSAQQIFEAIVDLSHPFQDLQAEIEAGKGA